MESEVDDKQPIKSYIIFDLESTGLATPGKKPRITELAMIGVNRSNLFEGGAIPRVRHELKLCFNPQKVIDHVASQMTGLYNDALESEPMFDATTVQLIEHFIGRMEQPACVIAHYGNGFDFRLLQSELKRVNVTLNDRLLTADSLDAFRVIDEKNRSVLASSSCSGNRTVQPGWMMSEVTPVKRKCDAADQYPFPHVPKKMSSGTNLTLSDVRKKLSFSPIAVTSTVDNHSESDGNSNSSHQYPDSCGNIPRPCLQKKPPQLVPQISVISSGSDDVPSTQDSIDADDRSISMSPCQLQQFSSSITDCEMLAAMEEFENGSPKCDTTSSISSAASANNGLHTPSTSCSFQTDTNQLLNRAMIRGPTCTGGGDSNSPRSSPLPYVSYKLPDIYRRHFGREPDVSHTAGDDCMTLLAIINKVGKDFCHWVDAHAVKFSTHTPFY